MIVIVETNERWKMKAYHVIHDRNSKTGCNYTELYYDGYFNKLPFNVLDCILNGENTSTIYDRFNCVKIETFEK